MQICPSLSPSQQQEEEEDEDVAPTTSASFPLIPQQADSQHAAPQPIRHGLPAAHHTPLLPQPAPYPPPYPAAAPNITNMSSNTNNAVELQPMAAMPPAPMPSPPPPKANDHFLLSISLLLISTLVCFNWFTSLLLVPAVICAAMVRMN